MWTRAPVGRVSLKLVESVISAIGVMPAIGSLEKLPSAYETAPMRRPSTYTGLPLIPAMTPVLAGVAGVCYRHRSDAAFICPVFRVQPSRGRVRVGVVVVSGPD